MHFLSAPLFYIQLCGVLAMIVVEVTPRWRAMRKGIAALCMTALTLGWLTLPNHGRWLLSLWRPASVLGGQIMFEMTPAVWWCALVLGLCFCGVAWIEAVERRPAFPLTGFLAFLALPTLWLSLVSGTLLTTLAAWSVFDLLWVVTALLSGAEGERTTFTLEVSGLSSLLLWAVFLLLQQEGSSVMWALMWPSAAALTLFVGAVLMRVGFYPFQIVFPERIGQSLLLSMVYWMGPLPGVALLYRLMDLPGMAALSAPVLRWGIFSMVWVALMAWSMRRRWPALVWAARGLLFGGVVGALAAGLKSHLLWGTAAWVAISAALMVARGRRWPGWSERLWSLPTALALMLALGLPLTPLGALFGGALDNAPWFWRIVFVLGLALASAGIWEALRLPAQGYSTPPWVWQTLGWALGAACLAVALLSMVLVADPIPFSWLAWGLWLAAASGGAALVRWGAVSHEWLRAIQPLLEVLDLQWLYRAVWRGAEHLLGVLRVSIEVVEGSGAVLWSLLVVLLILLVGGGQ